VQRYDKYKREHPSIIMPDFGKVSPQCNDMEEAVLGAIMVDKDAILSVIDILKPESFYRESHQKIFKAIIDLTKKNFPTDLYSVTEELRSHGELECAGGPLYITQLTSKIISASNIEYHAHIIAQKYMQRELIRISTEVQTRAFDDTYDIAELFEYTETSLMDISNSTYKKRPKKLSNVIGGVIDTIEKIISGEIKLVGVPSGIISLDRATGGFKKGELTIIACRPSVGKTSLACQVAKNASLASNPIAFFSLEMSEEELGRRYLSGMSGRSNTELINGRCNIEQLIESSQKLNKLPLYIDDTPAISIIELKSKTRRLIMEKGVKMIIVDYLQLMKGEGQNREQEVASISRGLKEIAKSLNIAVIGLSQLNRRLENTADKKPNLSDLRESGSIEMDADIVIFPYRPILNGQMTIRINNIEEDTKELMMLILAKNRNGIAHIELKLKHNESLTNIWEEEEFKANIPPEFEMTDEMDKF
jgi:replicative DNA helicase